MKKQHGFGMIELMIGLSLSSILLGLLLSYYVFSKRQYHHVGRLLEQELELHLLSQLIRDSVRAAGFTPCLGLDHLIIRDRRDKPRHIKTVDIQQSPHQSLQVSGMDEHFLLGLNQKSPDQLLVSGDLPLEKGREVMIADCLHAEINYVKNCQKSSGAWLLSLAKPLYFTYPSTFYVSNWLEARFFIAKNAAGNKALFYANPHSEELTSRIIGLRTEFAKPWLYVRLWLKDGKELLLETRIRTP